MTINLKLLRRLECNDLSYLTFTNIHKMHSTLLNSKVSKHIRDQGETLFCWAFAISTMLRQSLNVFISDLDNPHKDVALEFLNSDDFHRQLRNELIMIPIPKFLSSEYNEYEPLSQGHYLYLAIERVRKFGKLMGFLMQIPNHSHGHHLNVFSRTSTISCHIQAINHNKQMTSHFS